MEKMDTDIFFSGSANFKYKPTIKMELGIGSSTYHSITAMDEYENVSAEEIRIEDYNASGGLFGSAIAKIGGALCVEAKHKLRPYLYGELYRTAIKGGMIQPVDPSQVNNIGARAPDKIENKYQKSNSINVTVTGGKYMKISINGPCVNSINLFIRDGSTRESTVQEDRKVAESRQLFKPEKKVKYPQKISHAEDIKHISPASKMKKKTSMEKHELNENYKNLSQSRKYTKKESKTCSHVPLQKGSENSTKKPDIKKEHSLRRQRK